MSIKVSKLISDDEILAHFIYDRYFSKKRIESEKLIAKDIFLPNKGEFLFKEKNIAVKIFAKVRQRK